MILRIRNVSYPISIARAFKTYTMRYVYGCKKCVVVIPSFSSSHGNDGIVNARPINHHLDTPDIKSEYGRSFWWPHHPPWRERLIKLPALHTYGHIREQLIVRLTNARPNPRDDCQRVLLQVEKYLRSTSWAHPLLGLYGGGQPPSVRSKEGDMGCKPAMRDKKEDWPPLMSEAGNVYPVLVSNLPI